MSIINEVKLTDEIRAIRAGIAELGDGVVVWRSEKIPSGWMGVCDLLNLTVQSDTLDELASLAQEASEMYFADLKNNLNIRLV